MEFPVCLFKGFGYPFYGFHNFQAAQQFHIYPAGVANQAQDGDLLAFRDVDIQILIFQPLNQVIFLFGGGSVFQYCNHFTPLLL